MGCSMSHTHQGAKLKVKGSMNVCHRSVKPSRGHAHHQPVRLDGLLLLISSMSHAHLSPPTKPHPLDQVTGTSSSSSSRRTRPLLKASRGSQPRPLKVGVASLYCLPCVTVLSVLYNTCSRRRPSTTTGLQRSWDENETTSAGPATTEIPPSISSAQTARTSSTTPARTNSSSQYARTSPST